jgi:hypothetical protein
MAKLMAKVSQRTIYMAMLLDDSTRQQVAGVAGPMLGASGGAVVQQAKGAGFGATLGGGEVGMAFVLMMPDDAAAQKLTTDTLASWQKSGNATTALFGALPVPASLKTAIKEMFETKQIAAEANFVVTTMSVKSATLEAAINDMASNPGGIGAPAAPQPGRGPARGPSRGGRP